jgi:parvulin-like peptidyl-prolyl isomerase
VFTKKHQARVNRERIQRRWILGGTIATFLLVLAILVYGWVDTRFIKPNQPIATVAGEQISVGDFQTRVRLALSPGGETVTIGYRILNEMIDDVLIRQEANRLGITVSKEEVDSLIQGAFGFYPEGTPTKAPTNTPDPSDLAEMVVTPTERPSPTVGPTPTPYTEEAFESNFSSYLDILAEQYNATEADYRAYLEAQLYREQLLQTFEEMVERVQDHVWIRHIRVDERETAEEILASLNEGEAWEDLAIELSTDLLTKDSGGELGWVAMASLVERYGQAGVDVFEASIDQIEGPIETDQGWYLIQVMDRGERPLDDVAYFQALQSEFFAWLSAQREASDIVILDTWIDILPQAPSLSP